MKDGSISVVSPDGQVVLTFSRGGYEDDYHFSYSLIYKNEVLIKPSKLGLAFSEPKNRHQDLHIDTIKKSSSSSKWSPLYWDRCHIIDAYNQVIIGLKSSINALARIEIILRVYDEGIAIRYHLPLQDESEKFRIIDEYTSFDLPEGCIAYEEHGTEGVYNAVAPCDIKAHCERPLTVKYPSGRYISITEAMTADYSRMLLSAISHKSNLLKVDLSGVVTGFTGYGDASSTDNECWSTGEVVGQTPFTTPWRVIIIGDRAGDLMERNYLLLNLNEPCALKDTAYIRPGKVLRSGLSTSKGIACVDFAVARNLQYIEFDAGWYGYEYDDASDASFISVDPKRMAPNETHEGLDLQRVINYAETCHIGVILYVNRRALETQLEEILPLYKAWGVHGLKFGFVNVGSQRWTQWLIKAVKLCAEYGLVVDIHDAYRPTGLSRTYPNLLTQEGVRGNEHMPTARHNTTLPFTRCVAGPADYTICYYDKRIKTTRAHQLALSVVIFSPLQFLYWYSDPSDYHDEAELEFFDHVPTTWDETRVLSGEIGEYVVVARRKEKDWFLGCITNEDKRKLSLPLSFLSDDAHYTMSSYGDGERSDDVIIKRLQTINSQWVLEVDMAQSGGQAICFQRL